MCVPRGARLRPYCAPTAPPLPPLRKAGQVCGNSPPVLYRPLQLLRGLSGVRVTEALKHQVVPPQGSSHRTDGDTKAGGGAGGPRAAGQGCGLRSRGGPHLSTPLVLRTAAGPGWGSACWGVTGAFHLQTREGQDWGCPGAPPQQSVRSPSGEPTPRPGPSAAAGVPLWVGSWLPLGWFDPPGRGAGLHLPGHPRTHAHRCSGRPPTGWG